MFIPSYILYIVEKTAICMRLGVRRRRFSGKRACETARGWDDTGIASSIHFEASAVWCTVIKTFSNRCVVKCLEHVTEALTEDSVPHHLCVCLTICLTTLRFRSLHVFLPLLARVHSFNDPPTYRWTHVYRFSTLTYPNKLTYDSFLILCNLNVNTFSFYIRD